MRLLRKSSINSGKVVFLAVVVCCFSLPVQGQYCSASGVCGYEYISGVQVGTINNTGTGCSGYADYTSMSTAMEIETGYPIAVTNGEFYLGDQCGIWVDWNQDNDFNDVDETISVSGGPETFTATITPPWSAFG